MLTNHEKFVRAIDALKISTEPWRSHQPTELEDIEQLVIQLSRYVADAHSQGEEPNERVVKTICADIKNFTHKYQCKAWYGRV